MSKISIYCQTLVFVSHKFTIIIDDDVQIIIKFFYGFLYSYLIDQMINQTKYIF